MKNNCNTLTIEHIVFTNLLFRLCKYLKFKHSQPEIRSILCFFKCVPACFQVCGVLESLEQEYRREEDWCAGGERQPEQLVPLISKHMEQKEAFLKVRSSGKPPQTPK